MADPNTGDIAPSKSYEETRAVQDEKVLEEKHDSDSGTDQHTGRRKSTAMNIIENPLMVSF